VALNSGRIAGAALDVLSVEPPPQENPLLTARNCLITPHMAWATTEARHRLMTTVIENVAGVCDIKVGRIGSGSPITLPVILKPAIDATATQGDNGIGTTDGPKHSRLLQSRSDDGFAAGLNHAGANK
jgi:hypothetical protein